MFGYDITVNGSTIDSVEGRDNVMLIAAIHSTTFSGRLVRVHDVDGITVVAEYRDGDLIWSSWVVVPVNAA